MNRKPLRLAYLLNRAVYLLFILAFVASYAAAQNSNGLTSNWAVKTPRNDGTTSKTYFNLRYDAGKITGSIRSTQFYYIISESTGGPEGFSITGKMRDGKSDRTVKYEGKLVGDDLQLSTRRRPEDKPTETVAHR